MRDVIRPADYSKFILHFAVLRRFECALAPTRDAVNRQAVKGVRDDGPRHCALSGHCSYNEAIFSLSNLGAAKHAPNATWVVDPFHVAKGANEALDAVRKGLQGTLDKKGRLELKKNLAHAPRKHTRDLGHYEASALRELQTDAVYAPLIPVDEFIDPRSGAKIDANTGELL